LRMTASNSPRCSLVNIVRCMPHYLVALHPISMIQSTRLICRAALITPGAHTVGDAALGPCGDSAPMRGMLRGVS